MRPKVDVRKQHKTRRFVFVEVFAFNLSLPNYQASKTRHCSPLVKFRRFVLMARLEPIDRKITSWTGASHFHKQNVITQRITKVTSEKQRNMDVNPLFFWRMPSIIATLPTRYPQKAVIDRQKNVAHDSMALAEIVPAPPKIRLIDVTTNSARNKIPPELPTSYWVTSSGKFETWEILVRYDSPVRYDMYPRSPDISYLSY